MMMKESEWTLLILKDIVWLRVDEKNKKIWNKATVEIKLRYKDMVSKQFNSNEEAQAWIDEIISDSGKKFKVIIKD